MKVLLDNGSDGDLLFEHGSSSVILRNKRIAPQKWRTSSGTFQTKDVGDLSIAFPEFSKSKKAVLRPDIVRVPADQPPPVYDLIVGVKSLANMGVVLDFADGMLTIDQVTLPMKDFSNLDMKSIRAQFRELLEPVSMREATNRAVKILDANYKKANLPDIIANSCEHLDPSQQKDLLKLLSEFEELFDGTLGDWKTDPVGFKLKPGAKPYHSKPYPVPRVHLETLKKEIKRLCELGVLKKQPETPYGLPTFVIPKKDETVRVVTNFQEVNKTIICTPYPVPKISTVLQEMEGFTYATSLDLNMGYYTIRLDGDAQKICTLVLPWGKYSYLRLPMGMSGSPDIFQENMSSLMESLEYVRVYIDDLLVITQGTYVAHLSKLREVLVQLRDANLKVNARKSFFAQDKVEYLGYVLCREGIKPVPQKVSAILAITPPKNVRELRRFLGMVQYYRDLWEKRSHFLAPLTDLVGECGKTKVTCRNGTKKKSWYWNDSHHRAFDGIKEVMARDVILAYPDFSEHFEVFTDASQRQLGAVIVQKGRVIAYFSRKLSEAQSKYSITKLELLSIVECLKEFKGMLWGQCIEVFTDHKNLTHKALGLTSERVYRWRLILEEYGPEIVYIKGVDNTVADALSRLEYDPEKNVKDLSAHTRYCHMATMLSHYMQEDDVQHGGELGFRPFTCEPQVLNPAMSANGSTRNCMSVNHVFATVEGSEEEIYPPTINEIAQEQRRDRKLKKYFKSTLRANEKDKFHSLKVIDETNLVVYKNDKIVVPQVLQSKIIQWYHHYLLHPGHTRLEETIAQTMYWRSLRSDVRKHVKHCHICQTSKKRRQKYGKLPSKFVIEVPWRYVCVDLILIGPYTLKGKDNTVLDFMCLTMIDPATGWFEIVQLPTITITRRKKGKEVTETTIDKSSMEVSRLFNKQWLSRYPRSKCVIYDNGSEFKLHFRSLCESYGLQQKSTTVRNPQANAILKRIHAVFGDMLRASQLDLAETINNETIDDFISNAAWAIRSTHHTVLKTLPGAAIFGRDMLFDIPYIADWSTIGRRRQQQTDRSNAKENALRADFDYQVGQKVLNKQDGAILRKAQAPYIGPFVVTSVHTNGTIRIQRGTMSERINIRRVTPYHEG